MATLMDGARFGRTIWRTYGWRGLLRRSVHEARRAAGSFRARSTAIALPYGSSIADIYVPRGGFTGLPPDVRERILDRGRRVAGGSYEAFGASWHALPSTGREWRSGPQSGFVFPDGLWWTVPHLPAGADIKATWEPARFAWVYDLVRAHALINDPAFAAAFHGALESWMASAPPFRGVHWSCGQETAIRAIAILHAEASFAASPAQAERIVRVLVQSAERIDDAIEYGLSQRNNHGISEASGLVHLGLRFMDQHPAARRWLLTGCRLLNEQVQDQFLDDGWYAQHSFYYMRVALDQALCAQRALRATGRTLDDLTLDRLNASLDLIAHVIDASTGYTPNVGANDGSRVVPISSSSYRDFRPLLTLGAIVTGRGLPSDIPVDPEVAAWLGAAAPRSPARIDGVFRGRTSGWVVARHAGWHAFMRAGSFRHRPGHLDLLHLCIGRPGREIIVDAGTYAYNQPTPWKNGLASAVVHNAPVVDGREPAARGPRFLWREWPSSRLVTAELSDGVATIVGEVADRIRRQVRITEAWISVTDLIIDPEANSAQVTWLLGPGVDPAVVQVDGGTIVPADDDHVDAWFSPTYLSRLRTVAVRASRRRSAGQHMRIETRIVAEAT